MSNYTEGYLDLCSVCHQPNAKYHYGILTCDGCKAFFRRTVLLNLEYCCRYRKNCDIESSRRNTCRACRLQKCLKSGMKVDTVRQGHDLGKTKRRNFEHREIADVSRQSSSIIELASSSGGWNVQNNQSSEQLLQQLLHDDSSLRQLSAVEMDAVLCRNLSSFVAAMKQIDEHSQEHARRTRQLYLSIQPFSTVAVSAGIGQFELTTIADSENCFLSEFRTRIELLKQFQSFQELSLKDRVALFRSNSVEFLMFSFLKRSEAFDDDFIVLYDERHVATRQLLPHLSSGANLSDAVGSLLDDVLAPFRELKIDSTELNCMRWIAFWNPEVCSVEIKNVMRKRQLFMSLLLEKYVNALPVPTPGRFANLMLLLKTLQSVAQKAKDALRLVELLDVSKPDELLSDIFKDPHQPVGPLAELLAGPITFTVPSLLNVADNQFEQVITSSDFSQATSAVTATPWQYPSVVPFPPQNGLSNEYWSAYSYNPA